LRWACERQTQQTITQLLGSSLRPITRTQMQHVCVAVDCQLPCVCFLGGGRTGSYSYAGFLHCSWLHASANCCRCDKYRMFKYIR
jgi:hypothetical protein